MRRWRRLTLAGIAGLAGFAMGCLVAHRKPPMPVASDHLERTTVIDVHVPSEEDITTAPDGASEISTDDPQLSIEATFFENLYVPTIGRNADLREDIITVLEISAEEKFELELTLKEVLAKLASTSFDAANRTIHSERDQESVVYSIKPIDPQKSNDIAERLFNQFASTLGADRGELLKRLANADIKSRLANLGTEQQEIRVWRDEKYYGIKQVYLSEEGHEYPAMEGRWEHDVHEQVLQGKNILALFLKDATRMLNRS